MGWLKKKQTCFHEYRVVDIEAGETYSFRKYRILTLMCEGCKKTKQVNNDGYNAMLEHGLVKGVK